MPRVREIVKNIFGKELNQSVNPDEAVALGAAIQGGVLSGEVKDVVLLDVTPLTLGLETLGGVATPLIERNTTIPTSKSQIFSTAADNQTQVEVNVVQGERPMATDNKSLGRFILDGVPSAPRGVPQIEVTFDIDANGILNVTAKGKATGKSQSITIKGSTGLSKEEVERMTEEAKAHAAEDQEKKERIEVKNKADNLIFNVEKTLKELGDKVKTEDKKEAEEKTKLLKDLVAKPTASKEEIEKQTNDLTAVLQRIGTTAYKQPKEKGEKSNGKASKDSNEKGKGEAEEGEVVE